MIRHTGSYGLQVLVWQASLPCVLVKPGAVPCLTRLRPRTRQQVRGKKTKTIVNLADLPQGLIPHSGRRRKEDGSEAEPNLDKAPDPDPEPAYPTVVQQARHNMQKFDNCVLLTRVGGFYELYFEHAEEYGPLLNLKVASKKTSAGPVPMAGFPFFQLDRFLKVLVQDLNRYVAVAEEFPNEPSEKVRSGGLMHDRRVSRIITPGTLIDENFIDPYANNFILAIHTGDISSAATRETLYGGSAAGSTVPIGLAWLDLSTGQFFTQSTNLASLPSTISRIGPREVILSQHLEHHKDHEIFSILAEDRHLVTYSPPDGLDNLASWSPFLESEVPEDTVDSFTQEEVLAGDILLNYVKHRLQGLSMKLQPPMRQENIQIMNIDRNSLRALEIKATIRDGFFRGSLLHTIRRTVTKSGARLLSDWLCSPSTSLDIITARQDLVARFIDSSDLRDRIIILLRRSSDSQRLVQKFTLGRGDPDDLLALAHTIRATTDIHALLQQDASPDDCIPRLISRLSLEKPVNLALRIRDSIDEEGIIHQHDIEDSEASQIMTLAENIVASEGSQQDASILPKGRKKRPISIREHYAEDKDSWIMKPGASPSLKKLHEKLVKLLRDKNELTAALRLQLDAPSLTLRWSPSLGHIAHVKGKDTKGLADYKAVSASRSTKSIHLPEWVTLGQRMDQVRFQIRSEEQRVFQSLREHVVLNLVKLRRNAAVLDELDIATSFARLAIEQRLVRPQLNNSTRHTIIGGRHPTVEGGLYEQGRSFVRNDCLVGNPAHGRLWLITGPNMAGKSTFLRQNALITILAQTGCYVPATFAEIGIVDAIFSRVGSADNLYQDQSTFMIEMLETAQILRLATHRSFVIMDEIGRGTTPEDGTAVAYACLHHLVKVNQCRTLFATHFHAVADIAAVDELCAPDGGGPVHTYCTDIKDDSQGGFVYVHKLRRGVNRQSHALKVAKLAGMPSQAIEMARLILDRMSAPSTSEENL